LLEIDNIQVSYGEIEVLHGISMSVNESDRVAVIGANGAGKSTLMKTIMGLLTPKAGKILFKGEAIQGLKPHRIVPKGIVLVPEGRKIFPKLTVRENLEMGAYTQNYTKPEFNLRLEQCYDIFPRLKERANQHGGTLSGGEQQMLAISRAIMGDPKLLMLDEPSLGLAPVIMDEVFEEIMRISNELKVPILLVEQNAYSSLEICTKAYVLELGKIYKEGTGDELLNDPAIINAYLGGS
jgi:branched-chain amino acid transport system ATP-binding protein